MVDPVHCGELVLVVHIEVVMSARRTISSVESRASQTTLGALGSERTRKGVILIEKGLAERPDEFAGAPAAWAEVFS